MEPVVQPSDGGSTTKEEGGFQMPNWAWGAGAGIAVAISGAAVTIVHVIGRRRRALRAEQDARYLTHDEQGTPRDVAPTTGPRKSCLVANPYDETPPPPGSTPFEVTPVSERDSSLTHETSSGDDSFNLTPRVNPTTKPRRRQPKKDEVIV